MKPYQGFFKIANDQEHFPFLSIEETLKRACDQILEGYRDESEALYDIETMEDTGTCRFVITGHPFYSSDVRAAIDLNEKFGWNLIKR